VAISALDRAVAKGVLHRNNGARRKSRLMKRLNASGQAAATAAPPTRSRASGSKASASKAPAKRSRSTKTATSKR